MAYAFKKIDDLIDKEKKQSNTNLFQTTQEPQQQDGQPEQKKVAPAQASSTNASSGGSSFAKIGEQTRPQQQYNQQGAYKAAVEANTGKTQIPGAIGKIGESLEQQQKDLQKRADEYSRAQKEAADKEYGHSQEDIDRAARGDEAAAGRLGGVLHPGAPRPVPEFPEGRVELPKDISLNTPDGIRKELERGKGQNYTRGQSNFDLQTLTGSEQFPRKIRELLAGQTSLSSRAKQLSEERKKESEQYIKNKILEQKGLTEQELAKYTEDLNRTEGEKLNRWNGELNSAYEEAKRQDPEFRSRHLGQAVQDFLAKIDATGSGISNNLKEILRSDVLNNPENVYKYISRNTELKPPYGIGQRNGFTRESADRYNRINALLGRDERKDAGFEGVPEHPDVSSYRGDPYKHDVEGAYKEYVTPDRVKNAAYKYAESNGLSNNIDYIFKNLKQLKDNNDYGKDFEVTVNSLRNDIKYRNFFDNIHDNIQNDIRDSVSLIDNNKLKDIAKQQFGLKIDTVLNNPQQLKNWVANKYMEKKYDFLLMGTLQKFVQSGDFDKFRNRQNISENEIPLNADPSTANKLTEEIRKIPGNENKTFVAAGKYIRNRKFVKDVIGY